MVVGLLGASACSDSFLEVEPTGKSTEAFYYSNESEAYAALVGVYDVVGWSNNGYVNKVASLNAASDDHYAGGGHATDINAFQVWSNYTLDPANGPQESLWNKGYSGAFRANMLLSKLESVEMNEGKKARFIAEAKFLRAFFYFDLIRLFKSIPLILKPLADDEIYSVEQAQRSDIFKQIEEDLKDAISDLPETVPVATEGGRATKGAALALLGKVYLQQEKFGLAAEQLAEVNGSTPGEASELGGYELLDNFADLWSTDNKYNKESIFEVGHTSSSNGVWDCVSCTEGNLLNILVGPRDYKILNPDANAPDLVSGWSFLTVTDELYDAFVQGGQYDPRYAATILNIDSLAGAGVISYTPAYMNTGYFLGKFAGREKDKSTGGGASELNYPQNTYEIRLADTYLLEAEALVRGGGSPTRAQELLDAVRARVGLGSVPATLDNIVHERRLELAGEGHRWFDLVRTGKAATALAFKGFVAGKHEYLPVPLLELTNTKLEQDPAYQ